MDEESARMEPPANATPEDLSDTAEMYGLAADVRRARADMLRGQGRIAEVLARMMLRNGCSSIRELIETDHLYATVADEILHAHEVPIDPDMEGQF